MQQVSGRVGGDMPAPAGTGRVTTPFGHVVIALDRAIYRAAIRWLLAINAVFAVHLASMLLAPVPTAAGYARIARPIYTSDALYCHRHRDRGFHRFGEQIAACERRAAIDGALLLVGPRLALPRGGLRAPRVSELGVLVLPAIVNGGAQALGIWQSTAARVVFGALLGTATCWWLLPWLASGFARMNLQIETLFARLVAEGRARPR